jgi:acyl carrier protein
VDHMIEIRNLLAEVFDIDEEEITPDAHFIETLEVDSLMALEVLVRLEKTYKIKISEEELKSITTLRKVHNLLQEKGAFQQLSN